jgi:hypothetical protein
LDKVKISVTIEKKTADEIEGYYRKIVVEAASSGKEIPKLSHVYEEIIKLGWETKKRELKK